jgi:hypothetical protein
MSMLDRGALEQFEQDVREREPSNLRLTQLERILLSMYRKMSETDQNHLRRIAQMMAQTD